MSQTKRNELSNLLRRLADYIDNRSDTELLPLIHQAVNLKPDKLNRKKYQNIQKPNKESGYLSQLTRQLQELGSREAGEALLVQRELKRTDLEALARALQLPVQRDDNMERLRAKIVENLIGSRLRSDAIQGRSPK